MDGWAIQAIITLIVIPVLGWYLSRLIKKKDEAEVAERKQWQRGAVERHTTLVKRFDSLEKCMREVKSTLNEKLDIVDFEKESAEKWARMNHHEHAIDCNSSQCSARRTSGVII